VAQKKNRPGGEPPGRRYFLLQVASLAVSAGDNVRHRDCTPRNYQGDCHGTRPFCRTRAAVWAPSLGQGVGAVFNQLEGSERLPSPTDDVPSRPEIKPAKSKFMYVVNQWLVPLFYTKSLEPAAIRIESQRRWIPCGPEAFLQMHF
jgi:hypothetical protein